MSAHDDTIKRLEAVALTCETADKAVAFCGDSKKLHANDLRAVVADLAARDALIGELRGGISRYLDAYDRADAVNDAEAPGTFMEKAEADAAWFAAKQALKRLLDRTPADAGAELARLREVVGVRGDAKSGESDYTNWLALVEGYDAARTLRDQLATAEAEKASMHEALCREMDGCKKYFAEASSLAEQASSWEKRHDAQQERAEAAEAKAKEQGETACRLFDDLKAQVRRANHLERIINDVGRALHLPPNAELPHNIRREASHFYRQYLAERECSRQEAIRSQRLEQEAKSAWANRERFCTEINIIGREIVGPRIGAWKGEVSCAPDAVTRETRLLIESLEARLRAVTEAADGLRDHAEAHQQFGFDAAIARYEAARSADLPPHPDGYEQGWKDAIDAAHREIQAAALALGWNTDGEGYACDQIVVNLYDAARQEGGAK